MHASAGGQISAAAAPRRARLVRYQNAAFNPQITTFPTNQSEQDCAIIDPIASICLFLKLCEAQRDDDRLQKSHFSAVDKCCGCVHVSCPLIVMDYSGVVCCNSVYKAVQTCVDPPSLVILDTRTHTHIHRQRRGRRVFHIDFTSILNHPLQWLFFLDECVSLGPFGKASHGPPCEGAEPPVCGPDHRPGSAAPPSAKGEHHSTTHSFTNGNFTFVSDNPGLCDHVCTLSP